MSELEVTWDVPAKAPGVREARVMSIEGKTSNNGEPMAEVKFKLTGGGEVKDFIMLGGAGKEMGLAKLERLGVPKGTTRIKTDPLIGSTLSVVCVLDTYQGRESLKIDGKANTPPYRLGYGSDVQKPDPDSGIPF